jgi:4,5-dihydroxyphthalate decarboxylase
MGDLTITFACLPYDRLLPILTGEVGVDGAKVVPIPVRWPVELFSRMIAKTEFDVAEMSITHAYVFAAERRAQFVALPIFPSRMFRHGFVFVHTDAGIRTPKDLEGRRIGMQSYQAAAPVWIRGILREEFGVDFRTVDWVMGPVNQRGLKGSEITAIEPKRPIAAERIGDDQMLSEMLANREVEALINPEIPRSLQTSGRVERLFSDYHARERDYFRRTGIFPIMHVMVMRRTRYEQHPWLASSIYKACETAKVMSLAQARFSGALSYMLPWMHEQLDEMDELFGDDPWPNGLTKNRSTLETFARMLVADGFLDTPPRIEDIFVPVEE